MSRKLPRDSGRRARLAIAVAACAAAPSIAVPWRRCVRRRRHYLRLIANGWEAGSLGVSLAISRCRSREVANPLRFCRLARVLVFAPDSGRLPPFAVSAEAMSLEMSLIANSSKPWQRGAHVRDFSQTLRRQSGPSEGLTLPVGIQAVTRCAMRPARQVANARV
jgi:hypothetical protein